VRAAATAFRSTQGWDAAKKVNDRRRHVAVDTTGLLLEVLATPASLQDRDAARSLLFTCTTPAASTAPGPMSSTPGNWSPELRPASS
jgi:hypothetical protein